MVPTPSILVAWNFSYLLLRVQQPWCVQSSLQQQQQQLVLLRNKQPNTPETSSRWHCQPMGTGSTCSPEDFHHLPMSRLFREFKSTSLKKKSFWMDLASVLYLLFRKTSANSHTRFTFHLAVFVGNRIIVNGPPTGFPNTKWHHISSSSEAALGTAGISWVEETKSNYLFLWLSVKNKSRCKQEKKTHVK